jgi:PRC-barrel domain
MHASRGGTGNRTYADAGHGSRTGLSRGALELKQVVNEKGETIGRINDFIFGKDGNNYVVLAVGDFTGLNGELIAIPFNSLKLDDPSGKSYCRRQVAQRWRSCQFSSANDERGVRCPQDGSSAC